MNAKAATFLLGILFALQAGAGERVMLKTDMERLSYSMGVEIARDFRRQGMTFDPESLTTGLRDEFAGEPLLLTENEQRSVLKAVRAGVRRDDPQGHKAAAEGNRRRGAEFRASNKAKKGVVTLPSGLQYRVLKTGKGRKPRNSDTVDCNYRGMFLDGTEFDATEGRPATLEVDRLIPGWKEALRLMPTGSKWELVVPPQLAYGARGVANRIGPNETLLFELELVAVK